MSDITKCSNEDCPLSWNCWRFNAPDSPMQSVAKFEYDGDDDTEIWCKMYWPMDNPDKNR